MAIGLTKKIKFISLKDLFMQMKKLSFSVCLCLFLITTAFSQNRSINFNHGSFIEVLQLAAKENKYVFVDCYTTWCGPCKYMSKNIFTKDEVADFYNENFICLKMDMENGEGIELKKKWEITGYPTLLFFNSNGEMVHRALGGRECLQFIDLGNDALNPDKQLVALKNQAGSNKADVGIQKKYIAALAAAGINYDKELRDYFSTQKDEDLTSAENWDMIEKFVKDPESREFSYLLNNTDSFKKLYTYRVSSKIISVYSNALQSAAQSGNDEKYSKIKTALLNSEIKTADKMIISADPVFYKAKKDWDAYAKAAIKSIEDYELLFTDSPMLSTLYNSVAWDFYENITDKELLNKGLEYAKKSVTLNPEYANTDTYAALLYKTGNYKEAKKQAEKAIELGKRENADVKSTEQLLEKIIKEIN